MTDTINVAKDFSKYPAGRTKTDGPESGERFREEYLIPAIQKGKLTIIELDGTRGYGSSFLEEAFGGLVRGGFSLIAIERCFEFKSTDKSLIAEINKYIKDQERDRGQER